MPTTADTCLVTVAELQEFARSTEKAIADGDAIASSALYWAQDRFELWAGRRLFVHRRTEEWRPCGWLRVFSASDSSTVHRYVWATEWPVVEIDASTGGTLALYTYGEGADEVRRIYATSEPGSLLVSYYAGYRRSDHDLAGAGGNTDLTGLSGLSGLTTLPPVAPLEVKDAICAAALYRIGYVGQQATTSRMSQQAVGQASYSADNVTPYDGDPVGDLFTLHARGVRRVGVTV